MSKTPVLNREDRDTIGEISRPVKGATRCQYGHYYTSDGVYLYSVEDEVELSLMRGEAKGNPTSIVLNDEVAEQDARGDTPEVETTDEVDLDGWLTGDVTYPFFKVKAAISKQYSVTVKNRKEAEAVIKEPPQRD